MKQKISSIIFSAGLPESDFLSLGSDRPGFMTYYGGRYTYLDLFLSAFRHLGSEVDYVVTSRYAEQVHTYLEKGWGETGWEILPFLPESSEAPFNRNMLQAFKTSFRPWVLLGRADTPFYSDLKPLLSKVKRRTKVVVPKIGKTAAPVVLVEKTFLLDQLTAHLKKGTPAVDVLHLLFKQLIRYPKAVDVSLSGFLPPVKNLDQYIESHRSILSNLQDYNDYFSKMPLHCGVTQKKQAVIESGGEVYNSMLADDCRVFGCVRNSILYPGVVIARGAEVVDSVILPGVSVAPGVKLTKTLIGEGVSLSQNMKYHILENVSVGRDRATAAAEGAPLSRGYSFISSGVVIPRGVTIGANCYLGPTVTRARFRKVKNISDGRLLT